MYILDVIDTCESTVLATVLPIVKNIMLMIQIIVPIALIIAFTVDFVKLSINPEEKDAFRKILNKIIAAVIIFMIPIIINAIMGAVGESTEFTKCWINADDVVDITDEDGYIPTNEDDDEDKPYKKPENPKNVEQEYSKPQYSEEDKK